MSKIDAPAIEPTAGKNPASEPAKKPQSRPRGRYIDFTPRRPKKIITPPPVVEETIIEAKIVPIVEEELGFSDPLAEFNELGSADTEEDLEEDLESGLENAQEDFLAEADPDDYVEEVLSQVSETRTEKTTVRRSPFLKNYHIEKRPLSSRAPERETLPSADALPPTPRKEFREEEFARRADSVPDNAEEPITPPEEKTGSRLGMFFTILITILLGAGVGVFVYLVFFQ